MNGGSLYEAVEPPILWKLLSVAVFEEIQARSGQTEVCGIPQCFRWYTDSLC